MRNLHCGNGCIHEDIMYCTDVNAGSVLVVIQAV
jgi:hypothetical protein